jgi:hypothetical protein
MAILQEIFSHENDSLGAESIKVKATTIRLGSDELGFEILVANVPMFAHITIDEEAGRGLAGAILGALNDRDTSRPKAGGQ